MIYKPFSNELGQRIYDNVSEDAWRLWIEQSKMLVNEYRIDLASAQGQRLMLEQAEKFFFGEGGDRPKEFVPPSSSAPPSSTPPPSSEG